MCDKMNVPFRERLENRSLALLNRLHPQDTPITIVSVGSGGLFQELVYLAKAIHNKITLVLIDIEIIPWKSLDRFCLGCDKLVKTLLHPSMKFQHVHV
jgi:hypothetical protein